MKANELSFLFFFSTYSERWHARQTRKGGMVIKLSQTDYLGSLLRSIISDQSFQMEDLDSMDSHRVLRQLALEETDREFSNKLVALSFRSLMKSSTKKRRRRGRTGELKERERRIISIHCHLIQRSLKRREEEKEIYILEYTPFNGMINPRSLYERKLQIFCIAVFSPGLRNIRTYYSRFSDPGGGRGAKIQWLLRI